ncbi:hypothetical protein AQS8620_01318 [Aquimixticola soesokkakensis]|uniref:Uncharacterized protein n=1 Tax=Aquimixticola soesokkakensis TaxID=1519096 RepID=A0A1Y5SBE2_9RHOB|nr:helix-turn-helix domain-containing protein [Aquimixticola soesokkakensis]SLN36766.1 hypothetical protein AQS8620_01318 [Aquimixticola soesokkakensis]
MLDAADQVPSHALHDEAVAEMTRAGALCPEIADALGITVRRVQSIRQRLRAAGVDLPYVRGHSGGRPAKTARNSSVERAYLRGDLIRKIARDHGISIAVVGKIIKRAVDAGRLTRRNAPADQVAEALSQYDPAFRAWLAEQASGGIAVLDVLLACAVDAWFEEVG